MSLAHDSRTTAGVRYYRSLALPAVLLLSLLALSFTLQVIGTSNARRLLAPLANHVEHMDRLQELNLTMQQQLIDKLRAKDEFTAAERAQMRHEITQLLALKSHLNATTPNLLAEALEAMTSSDQQLKDALTLALARTREAIQLESDAHQNEINAVDRALAAEYSTALLTLALFTLGAGIVLFFTRQRILQPLRHLSYLMTLLERRDYVPAPVAGVDAMLRPLTKNYNSMVSRLAALEKQRASREQDLEAQVTHATGALLAQQRRLANTERLAMLGETNARLAHELRNPLAGVKLACANLRQELDQVADCTDYVQRIDLVAAEVDRIIALLNSLLDQSRHRPEPLRDVRLAQTVEGLVSLLRYQIPAHISVTQQIDNSIVCRLPDAMLQQALFNLVLNAQQALAEQAGEIVITAVMEAGRLKLTVRDNGPGLPRDLLQAGGRAFVTHRAGGTGLGLSMVQRFARDLGGALLLANVEPHGACVTLDLPCGGAHG